MAFRLNQTYSRAEIHNLLGGGGIQEYLPSKEGRIVAGCFVPDLNPHAPERVYVGSGPRIISQAKLAVLQKRPIPCFLKRATKEHVYVGIYRAVRMDLLPESIRLAEAETGRNEISGILHFEPVGEEEPK
jgi:hypothetical protein